MFGQLVNQNFHWCRINRSIKETKLPVVNLPCITDMPRTIVKSKLLGQLKLMLGQATLVSIHLLSPVIHDNMIATQRVAAISHSTHIGYLSNMDQQCYFPKAIVRGAWLAKVLYKIPVYINILMSHDSNSNLMTTSWTTLKY